MKPSRLALPLVVLSSPHCSVVAIFLPELWSSQVIVFFGPGYYDMFFDRSGPGQTWTALPPRTSLVREWELLLPAGFVERGYDETIVDEDSVDRDENWFFGELD